MMRKHLLPTSHWQPSGSLYSQERGFLGYHHLYLQPSLYVMTLGRVSTAKHPLEDDQVLNQVVHVRFLGSRRIQIFQMGTSEAGSPVMTLFYFFTIVAERAFLGYYFP